MPSYLTSQLGFNLSSAGLLSVIPFFVLFFVSVGGGRIFQWLKDEKDWSVRDVRQFAQRIGLLGSGAGLVICAYLDNVGAAFTFMTIAQVSCSVCILF
jgi:hypothetical protein